jgi:hypothetical protein
MSKINLTKDGRLYQLKNGIKAKVVTEEFTKIIHIYDCFQIWEYLDKKGQVINQILKLPSFSLNQKSLYLKQLISELEILNKELDEQ